MPDDTRTYLGVFDFGDDEAAVTALLGLEPTEAYSRGDVCTLPSGVEYQRRKSAWRLDSPLPRTAHVDDQIEALLCLIEPHAEAIREAASRYSVGICCAIYYVDQTPGIHLAERTVRRLGSLGLSVDFDLYFLLEQAGDDRT